MAEFDKEFDKAMEDARHRLERAKDYAAQAQAHAEIAQAILAAHRIGELADHKGTLAYVAAERAAAGAHGVVLSATAGIALVDEFSSLNAALCELDQIAPEKSEEEWDSSDEWLDSGCTMDEY